MIKHLLIILILSFGALIASKNTTNCNKALKRQSNKLAKLQIKNGIVPDVIDIPPRKKVGIHYNNGFDVNPGNKLTPFSVKDEPRVEWPTERGKSHYYTLIMTDPDVPTRKNPFNGEYKHWIVMNIPENDLTNGETITPYRGSQPPKGSGLHRYVFLVFKQPAHLRPSGELVLNGNNGRDHFKARKFAKLYNLGQPVAVNFFLAESDDYSSNNRRGRVGRHSP